MHTAVWMTLVALGISALLSGWDGIEARNGQKVLQAWKVGLPVTAIGGFVGGVIAQVMFTAFFDRALERAMRASSEREALEIMESALRVPRAISFLVAGAIVGIALGVASGRSRRRSTARSAAPSAGSSAATCSASSPPAAGWPEP
jgi:hypothetical protein